MEEAKRIILLDIYNQIKLSLKDDKFIHNIKCKLHDYIIKHWAKILENKSFVELKNILILTIENKNDMNVLSNLIYDLAN